MIRKALLVLVGVLALFLALKLVFAAFKAVLTLIVLVVLLALVFAAWRALRLSRGRETGDDV